MGNAELTTDNRLPIQTPHIRSPEGPNDSFGGSFGQFYVLSHQFHIVFDSHAALPYLTPYPQTARFRAPI